MKELLLEFGRCAHRIAGMALEELDLPHEITWKDAQLNTTRDVDLDKFPLTLKSIDLNVECDGGLTEDRLFRLRVQSSAIVPGDVGLYVVGANPEIDGIDESEAFRPSIALRALAWPPSDRRYTYQELVGRPKTFDLCHCPADSDEVTLLESEPGHVRLGFNGDEQFIAVRAVGGHSMSDETMFWFHRENGEPCLEKLF